MNTAMLQQAAQTAAQNVMRRNKLRAMIGKTAGAAGGGGATMGSPIHAQNLGRPIGTAGGINRPGGVIGGGQTLAQQLLDAMGHATTPGAFNPTGGGADFTSVPDPNDGHQSPQTLPNQGVFPTPGQIPGTPPLTIPTPPPGTPGYTGGAAPAVGTQQPVGGAGAGATSPGPSTGVPGALAGGGSFLGGAAGAIGSPAAGVGGGSMIPLGGGLFYDPHTDSVVGPGGTPGAAGATRAS